MASRTVRRNNFRKVFTFTCIAFVITIGLVINRPASATVTVTPGANFQVDITAAEAVSVDCSGGFVRVTVNAVPNVSVTPCNTVTSLRVTATGAFDNTINLSAVTTAGFTVLTSVDVDGGAGNDTITGSEIGDQLRGGLGDDTINGGLGNDMEFGNDGNDTLIGGSGNDQLYGDDGDDRFGDPAVRDPAANDPGNDQFFGGGGSDQFFWDPGDGDDLVEGGAGDSDQIQFFGNAGAEQFFVFADVNVHSRLHIFRVQAAIDIDSSDIEEVNVTANGGVDTVTVGRSDPGSSSMLSDLSTTNVRAVNVALGDDGAADSIVVEGRPTDDNVLISLPTTGNFDFVKVAGLSYDVILFGLDSPASDRLTVNGNDGNDVIKASPGVEQAMIFTLNGGVGNDVLSGDGTLNGNDGNDTIEGGPGDNAMDGGAGDDVFIGNGGADNLGGGLGSSVGDAILLPGTAGNETFSLAMDGSGHLLATVNGVTTTYQNFLSGPISTSGIELISVAGLAGNDALTVDSATAAVPLPINFAGGENVDSLNLTGGVATSDNYSAGPLFDQGISQVVIGGVTQTVSFSGIEPMTDLIAGPFTVNGNNANNSINYMQGSAATRGFLSVDNFETVEFSNKTGLTINGLAGDDVINLNNSATPTGLTSITVNGNDPTASDTLIVNGTSGNNTFGFSPSATIGAGNLTINAQPPVAFTTMESVVIDGQGGADALTHTTPAGIDQVTYVPGSAPDSGTIATRGAGAGTARVPMTFRHLGAVGSVTFASAGGREDVLELFGTDDSDVFIVNGTADTIQILTPSTAFVTDQLNTGGISILQLRGLNGDDTFNLAAVLPYTLGTLVDGGDPSASDTLNLTGATGAITRNAAGQISGFGGTVNLLGIERVSLAGSGGAATLAIDGTAGDDTISFSPTAANAGSFAVGGTNFSYSTVGGAFTVNGGTGFDTLAVLGTSSDDVVTSTATTVTVNGATVTLGTGLERLSIATSDGNDNITLTGLSIAKVIDAGAGNDTVDCSAAVDAIINGGAGDDSLTGSPAADTIDGGSGNDSLIGLAGADILSGGTGNDALTGGTGADQMFGDGDSDILIWNNGDGSDLMEGGDGTDTVQVNGSNVAGDTFQITPNGARVRFDRISPGPFNLDIAQTEELTVNGLDGDDTFNVAPQAETHVTINGGNPVPPAAPGDQLNIDFTGATNSIKTPTGVGSGIWSFNNRQSINFNGIETQGPVVPGISINNVAVTEGNAGSLSAIFTATLATSSAQTVSVDVSTSNGTATAPVDYQSAVATLTFPPGVTTANFSVPINGDTIPEGNETYFVNLTNAVNATIATAQGTGTINDDDATNIFQFSSATANVNENAVPGSATVTVTRTGDLSGAASVTFETSDGSAKQRTDYTFGFGTVDFGPGEGSKDVKILIVNDVLVEGPETFTVSLLPPAGASAIGSPGTITVTVNDNDVAAAPNPIDDAGFFVRQHYLDFLGREPDAGGLAFWTAQITACGANASCIAAKRVDVSASFFLSIEFQETGGYALRIQRVAFGRQSNDQFTRYPYLPFMRDARTIGQGVIIGQPGADALLEQNKQAYANGLVATEEFAIRFPSAPAAVYVDALFASAGATPTVAERTAAINAFGAGGTTGRVAALRSVVDSASVRAAESRVSFVLAEYYGYLRRNPTDAPDFNNAGYQFWLDKLNLFNGNYIDSEMVKAFITSIEYRQRFGS